MWAHTAGSLYSTGGLLIGSSVFAEAGGDTTDMGPSVVLMEGASGYCIGFLQGGTETLEAAGDGTFKSGLSKEAKSECIAFVPSELQNKTETPEMTVGVNDNTPKNGLLEAKSNCIVFGQTEVGTLQAVGDGLRMHRKVPQGR